MKVIIAKNYEEMSAKAARFVLAHLWRKPDIVLGLPTGATPIGMYERLSEAHAKKRADFSRSASFNLDEYAGLSEKNKESFHSFMDKHLFDNINIKKSRIHIPNGMAKNLDQECEQYEGAIHDIGGIDLQILGIAANGHIGFNEPGALFAARTHVVELSDHTRKKNAKYFSKGVVPEKAITMGLGTIMESRKILLLASGKEKAKAIAETVEGKVRKEIPSSLLQWHHEVTVIIDQDAAEELKRDYASPFLFGPGDVEVLSEQDLPTGARIAVISPHPDDGSISLGGLICALSKKNKVNVIIATSGYRSSVNGIKPEQVARMREKEARLESKILGSTPIFLRAEFYDSRDQQTAILRDISKLSDILKKSKPDILFIPQERDAHPTHSTARRIVLEALEMCKIGQKVSIWEFEGLWSLFSEGGFNTIFAYDEAIMRKKMRAILSQKSQTARTRFDVAAKSLALLRAAIVPEQALVGYGARAPKLGKYFELFNVV